MSEVVRLLLVTHAQTTALREARFPADEPLDAAGLKAVGAVQLDRRGRVLSDDSQRVRQTCAGLGVDAELEPAVADLDVGRWRGLSLDAVPPDDVGCWLTDPAAAPHGGESFVDLVARVGAWLDRLLADPGRVIAVTHPAVVRAAVVHALDAPPAAVWRVDVPPLSTTRLHGRGGRWTLRLG